MSIHVQNPGQKFWLATQNMEASRYREYSKRSLGVNLEKRPLEEALGTPVFGKVRRNKQRGLRRNHQ